MDHQPEGLNRYEQLGLWFIKACKAAWMPPYTFSFNEKKMKKFMMEVLVDKTYLSVVVNVNPKFWNKPAKEQKLYLAHELWHVIADRADRIAEEAIRRVGEEDEENGPRLESEYLEASEKLADHAANLLMPVLPDWDGVADG